MADLRTNLELATVALNALEELERRGNTGLVEQARRLVSFFHNDLLFLKSKATALAAEEEEMADYE